MISAAIHSTLFLFLITEPIIPAAGQITPREGQRESDGKEPPTAFPHLKPPMTKTGTPDYKKLSDRVSKQFPLPVPSDAPAQRKVLLHQANEGAEFLRQVIQHIADGNWNPAYTNDLATITHEFFRVAAEMEATPAARVPWYEERVVFAKAFEEFMRITVLRDGNQPPHALHLARFRRLQAEAELLKVKEEVGKGEKKVDGRKQESMRDGRGVDVPGFLLEGRDQPRRKIPSTYTAFPNLRPPKRGEDWNDTEVPELPRPKSADGDSALRQFHVVQVREGRNTCGASGRRSPS